MLGPGLIKYKLIRSKRKTLSLQINAKSELIVRSPNKLNICDIEKFIFKKSNWIKNKIQQTKNNLEDKVKYTDYEKFLYLGNLYPLKINLQQKQTINFDGEFFYINNSNNNSKNIFYTWYKDKFISIATPRLDYYAQKHNLPYRQVRFKAQKTVWGSCSAKNNINLNYLLVMAPIAVIDYVIVHELTHTIYKNHAQDFWALVKKIMPNYKTHRLWLKKNGHKLQKMQHN